MAKKHSKIIVVGLNNSGKTSIVLNRYKKETNLLTYLSLKPTRKIEITEIDDEGTQVNIWDLGGQKEYRNSYLEKMEEYIPKTDELIYVLDIQDKQRYEEAIEYFRKVVESIQKSKINPLISLYLHKYDPGLEEIDPSITEEIIAEVSRKFIDLVLPNMKLKIYKTSIYTFFRMISYEYER